MNNSFSRGKLHRYYYIGLPTCLFLLIYRLESYVVTASYLNINLLQVRLHFKINNYFSYRTKTTTSSTELKLITRVLAKRAKASKKYNDLVTGYLDIKNKQLELVLKEEKAIRKKVLGVKTRRKRKAKELKEEDNNNKLASSIRGSFKKNLEPLIKRLEVKIIKKSSKKHRVSYNKIEAFIRGITNPKAIKEFYTRDKEIKVKEDNYNNNIIIIEVSTNKEEDNKEEFSK
ncbi:uncharacterized protein RCO7_11509 [Rhynchosporium graminicola]|uniref:Uncharacterized protein n=1 Tax=Rhynchosporium graminicola TaxID=2792576 RepID=A0A1E1KRI9_9HELO|nr:uncharacterized protein RCO7_11509 [Rhynchosporium commune]